LRHPLVEVSQGEHGVQQALLLPGQAAPGPAEAAAGGGAEPGGVTETADGAAAEKDERQEEIERERRELGYSIAADGVIEIHRDASRGGPTGEPVN
jgi:hypothetical protein